MQASTSTREFGARGEQLAADYLTGSGYEIVERNWRCPHGEIDIIARRGDTVVFVEVKTRSGIGFGHPFEAVTRDKVRRLRRLVGAWCAQTAPRPRRMRIDVIGILWPPDGEPALEHLKQVG
ncbi:putative endonuclease [Paramicrobacterium humi]|uniref:UPF0102 protein SAMN04489806_3267 n=1 Tax=Paramicrobacterium humi TaxID=640635 RepID=A0A1H4TNI6_9MICO|nr:YraN family protein [Microbacterium humi]SEC58005.1 putative endonuclease [Microbacterium humi]